MRFYGFILVSFLVSLNVSANEVLIKNVVLEARGNSWTFHTTLLHEDTGWEHYADAWRVVDSEGHVLATRTLFHPHENEQPFTRSLSNIILPKSTSVIFVEAHDKVHGWSKKRARIEIKDQKIIEVVLP